ncbi:hypothetical protein SAMN05444920_1613 [Nonomuraea solani]|uniref:Uncharacterized protein n=1 Tax=Nonomuraea solani TaxID=1144553 RepID=A0A1H6F544_9ACTN|nr:hypothetical protein SAMN05444920_1613 [Nonomuraea solani]
MAWGSPFWPSQTTDRPGRDVAGDLTHACDHFLPVTAAPDQRRTRQFCGGLRLTVPITGAPTRFVPHLAHAPLRTRSDGNSAWYVGGMSSLSRRWVVCSSPTRPTLRYRVRPGFLGSRRPRIALLIMAGCSLLSLGVPSPALDDAFLVHQRPAVRAPALDDNTGRGLWLVDMLANAFEPGRDPRICMVPADRTRDRQPDRRPERRSTELAHPTDAAHTAVCLLHGGHDAHHGDPAK